MMFDACTHLGSGAGAPKEHVSTTSYSLLPTLLEIVVNTYVNPLMDCVAFLAILDTYVLTTLLHFDHRFCNCDC